MPIMALRVTVPANGTSFPLSGQQYEFLPEPSHVEFAIAATVTGLKATIYSGSDLLQQEGEVSIKGANVAPVYPDDYHLDDNAPAGSRLSVQLRNTTGAAIDAFCYVKITSLLG